MGIQRATRDRYIWASTDLVVRWSTIVEVPARQRSEMYRKTKGMSFIGTPGSISRVDHWWYHLVVGHRRVGAGCWPRFVSQDSRYRGLLVVVVGHRTARNKCVVASRREVVLQRPEHIIIEYKVSLALPRVCSPLCFALSVSERQPPFGITRDRLCW